MGYWTEFHFNAHLYKVTPEVNEFLKVVSLGNVPFNTPKHEFFGNDDYWCHQIFMCEGGTLYRESNKFLKISTEYKGMRGIAFSLLDWLKQYMEPQEYVECVGYILEEDWNVPRLIYWDGENFVFYEGPDWIDKSDDSIKFNKVILPT